MTEPERFGRCLAFVLSAEGGYSHHPNDPGGPTNRGVTLQVAREAGLDVDHDGDVDAADIKNLTPTDAGRVYRARYWKTTDCEVLPAGLDLQVFDCAVNMGPRRARDYLQIACGVKRDGIVGSETLAMVHTLGARRIIYGIELLRKNFYHASVNYPTFGKGWLNRLTEVTSQALMWAD